METLSLYNEDGSLADLESKIRAIPNRIMRQIDAINGICIIYQVGDALPGISEEQQFTNVKNTALEQLRLQKWQAKNSGITVDGIQIDTDSLGQETISGAVLNCLIDSTYTARWKTSEVNLDGSAVWVTLTSEIIFKLAAALSHYTAACFAVEEQKQIELSKLTTIDAIQNWLTTSLLTNWPIKVYTS